METYKYVLFDFDDVINIYNRHYTDDNIDQAIWIGLLKKRKKEKITLQKACKSEGIKESDVLKFYYEAAKPNYPLLDKIKDLEFTNRYTIGIFSNNSPLIVVNWLRQFGLKKYFEFILTPENLGWNWKPTNESFYKVIDTLNCLPSDILFFDDDIVNIVASTKFGFKSKHYTKNLKISF